MANDLTAQTDQSLLGRVKAEVDTPALLLDLDRMEANIARIVSECRAHGVSWRPHAKVHKSPDIAKKLIAAGAIGVTCAKLGEAEVMAAASIRDILIANQIVGDAKIARLLSLAGRADPIICADDVQNLDSLDRAANRAGRRLRVAIEVDTGMSRAGVEPHAATVAFAREVARRPNLRFAGLMAWEGHTQAIADPAEKRYMVAVAVGLLVGSAAACRAAGHAVDIVSCGGSGTFPLCIQQPGITEVQVGGLVFNDMHYKSACQVDFPFALTVLCTVTSRPTPTRIVLDAGMKAMSRDTALPHPLGVPAVKSIRLSAEHASITLEEPSETPRVGDLIEFVPGYADTTVHLHEEIIGLRNGRIESVWRTTARGKLK